MLRKIISVLMVCLVCISSIVFSFAESYTIEDLNNAKSLDEYKRIYENLDTGFESEDKLNHYLQKHWEGVFPVPINHNGYSVNYPLFFNRGLLVYGTPKDVQPNGFKSGYNQYLGFNAFGGKVSNVLYPENTMNRAVIVDNIPYLLQNGLVSTINNGFKPYKSVWNDQYIVADKVFKYGENPEKYSQAVIDMWLKNIENRLSEYYGGQKFSDFMGIEQLRNSFVITTPPTGRTTGSAVAWFDVTNPKTGNHYHAYRTLTIAKTPNLDLIGKDYIYNADTKVLTVNFDAKSLKFVDDSTRIRLSFETMEKNLKTTKSIDKFTQVNKANAVDNYFVTLTSDEIKVNLEPSETVISYSFDLSKILKDDFEGSIDFVSIINVPTIVEEENLENNFISGTIENKPGLLDFSLKGKDIPSNSKVGQSVEISLFANLEGSKEDKDTVVKLYDKSGKEVNSQNVHILNGDSAVVRFNIDGTEIKSGSNEFYAVVNSDFNLSKAMPVEGEKDLNNNKIKININANKLVEDVPEHSSGCGFGKDGDSGSYGYEVCDEEGSCHCEYDTVDLYHSAQVEFTQYSMGSDSWSNDKRGQQFRPNAVIAKDLNGNPARDNAMAMIGINPLRQIIRAADGIQVKGVITVTGSAENFNSYDHTKIQRFINDLKENIYVSGKSNHAGVRDARNNQGEYYQRLEEDPLKSTNISYEDDDNIRSYGDDDCREIEVYKTRFRATIPVIVTKPTGYIDQINGEKKPIPNERKWFTYLNDFNGDYSLKLVANINQGAIGVRNAESTTCEKAPDEFKFSIFGTIFDKINMEEMPEWDN